MVGLNLQQAAAPQRRAVADPDIALLRALEGQSSAPLTTAYSFNLTGVLSEAAATWGRRMALARVQPAMPALDANLLWRAAWGLAFYGEHVEIIDVRDGRLVLTPSYYFEVDGFGMDPNGWVYQADMSSPDQHAQRTVRGAGVLHFRLPGPEPWRGQHTLEKAVEFKALVAQLERAMVDEAGTPVKRIVPIAEGSTQETRDELQSALRDRRKRITLPATTTAAEGEGRAMAPLTDWKPQMLRPDPTTDAVQLRDQVREQCLAAFGIPPASVANTPSGLRDADRLLRLTLMAVSAVIACELTAKLETQFEITFERAPADTSMLARSIKGFVEAGYSVAEAAGLLGLPAPAEKKPTPRSRKAATS